MKPIIVIDAPSNLGLKPPRPGKVPGVYQMPDALRQQEIIARLGALDGGTIAAPPYNPAREPQTGIRNALAIRDYSILLAEYVQASIEKGQFPLLLGGDCSILIGAMLGLRKIGRCGLVFIDGHHDLLTPETSQTGGAAGMDLALVSGRGPEILTNLAGLKPYVLDEDIVLIGECTGSEIPASIQSFDLTRLRKIGMQQVAIQTLQRMQENRVDGFWIHLDADVLHNDIMPAVDSPLPDGIRYDELIELLRALFVSELAAGMEITIFDPDLDPDGSIARDFTNALVAGIKP